ncbi:LEM domain-containing protein 2 [Hyperolius riggenbachi]|uniref:LEM domain-containing protein 2 n=1 Tax=Hyperolius riggenbachi TaxID=752182 RepID=UPI0035A3B45A
MSDEQLKRDLLALGYTPGPITDSTRKVLEKKLQKLREEASKSSKSSKKNVRSRRSDEGQRHRDLQDDDGGGEDELERWAEYRATPAVRSQKPERAPRRDSWGEERQEGRLFSGFSSLPTHLQDTGPRGSDRSSLTRESVPRTTEYLEHESRSLPADRFERYSSDYGSRGQEARYSLGGDRFGRATSDYSGSLGHEGGYLGGERFGRGTDDYSASLMKEPRSSLGGGSFASTAEYGGRFGLGSRSSLGEDRFARGVADYSGSSIKEPRSFLGGSLASTAAYSGSLGLEGRSSLGGERSSGSIADYSSSLGQDIRSPLGGDRFASTSVYRSSLGQELRSRPIGERSSLSGLLTNREQDRSLYQYGVPGTHRSWTAKDQLSKYGSHGKPQNKPNWSRAMEYYLSRLLWALSVLLVIVFLGILVVKSGVFYSKDQNDIKLLPSECDGKDDQYCKAKQKQIILQILSELYEFLSLEAGSFECGNPSGLSSKCVPVNTAKDHILTVTGHTEEKFDSALDWLLASHAHLGIWAKDINTEIVNTRPDVYCLESSHPRLGTTCRLKNALHTAISNLFLALFGLFVLWLFLIYLRFHWQMMEKEEQDMYEMVKKIIDIVKNHYEAWTQGIEAYPYIGIFHVRDTLISPQDRRRLKKSWDRAVQFIEDNESRLRTETQRVAGADLRVWRWTQARNLYPSLPS